MARESTFSRICAMFLVLAIVAVLIQTAALFPVQYVEASTSVALVSESSQNAVVSSGNFSVIWVTDTQHLSELYPSYYDSLCRWIVNHSEMYNVKLVIHTGDIVDTEGNQTQWANANASMSILLDAGIPYCWNAGNHDYNATCWIGNQYVAFNPAFLSQKSYWVGDEFSGQNTAISVNVSGWSLLVVNLENLANDTALQWANSVLDAYPDSHAIVATHAYLNDLGKYTYRKSGEDASWAENFNTTVLEKHPNIFMTLSGHFDTESGTRTRVGDREELMFDRQDRDGYLGGATLRILTFDTAQGFVDVKTYVLYANSFPSGPNNQFTVETQFRNDYAQSVPELSVAAVSVLLAAILVTVLLCRNRIRQRNAFPSV